MKSVVVAIFVLFAIVACGVSAEGEEENCNKLCTYNYAPICAGPAEEGAEKPATFGNDCALEVYNCQHKDKQYVVKYRTECKTE